MMTTRFGSDFASSLSSAVSVERHQRPADRSRSSSNYDAPAYSFASSGLWIEQGPTITTILSDWPESTSAVAWRAAAIVSFDCQVSGTSARRTASAFRHDFSVYPRQLVQSKTYAQAG